MTTLAHFPMLSQRDGDINADMDCVPASIAACLNFLTGSNHTASEIKDAVYGSAYTGGTAAIKYVDYCSQHGATLTVVDGDGLTLVNAIHRALSAGHPVLITEPDPYMPASTGFTHVCAAYQDDANSITVMDPWIDGPVQKTNSVWQKQLQFNQVWTMERHMVPAGWKDDGTTLTASNGFTVVLGFRKWILGHSWNGSNGPMEEEHGVDKVLLHNPGVGSGTRQCFRDGLLWWTNSKGVIYEPQMGAELYAAYQLPT